MTKNFADVGVKYSLGGKTGNTLDSHRLATWVKDKHGLKKQDEVMTAMFQAYFSDEKFLGDRGVLVAAAESAGLSGDDARAPPCPLSLCRPPDRRLAPFVAQARCWTTAKPTRPRCNPSSAWPSSFRCPPLHPEPPSLP